MKIFINLLLFLFVCKLSFAQIEGVMGRIKSTTDGFKGGETSGRKDSAALGFERRDDRKDSLNLTFRVLDSIRNDVASGRTSMTIQARRHSKTQVRNSRAVATI